MVPTSSTLATILTPVLRASFSVIGSRIVLNLRDVHTGAAASARTPGLPVMHADRARTGVNIKLADLDFDLGGSSSQAETSSGSTWS